MEPTNRSIQRVESDAIIQQTQQDLGTKKASAAGSTGTTGAAPSTALPLGDITGLVEELYAILSEVSTRVGVGGILGAKLVGGSIKGVDSLTKDFQAMIKNPSQDNVQAFYNQYQSMMKWQDGWTPPTTPPDPNNPNGTSDNPAWPIIQQVGGEFGLSSTEEGNLLNKVAQGGKEVDNQINAALNQLNPVVQMVYPGATMTGILSPSESPADSEQMLTTVAQEIHNNPNNPTIQNAVNSCENGLEQTAVNIQEVVGVPLAAGMSHETGAQSSLVSASQSIYTIFEKAMQSFGNMWGG